MRFHGNRLRCYSFFTFRKLHLSIFLLLGLHGLSPLGMAEEWLTGPSFQRQLSEPISMVLSESPLRDAIDKFSRTQQIAVLLDRRVDPSRKISLSLDQSPTTDSLAAMAMTAEIGVTAPGPLAYFGPTNTTARLRTLVTLREEEARKKSPDVAKKYLHAKAIAWEDFSQPRAILEILAKENGIKISGLEKIPHDLWASADLPPISLAERITLILVQYDLTFSISSDGKQIEIGSLPEDIRLERSYPGEKKPNETAKRFSELLPHAEVKVVGDKVSVKGSLEDHERITAPRTTYGHTSSEKPDLSKQSYTLKVSGQPIGPLLKQLSTKIGLQLQMDEHAIEKAGVSLEQHVSFQVDEATVDQLLQAAIKDTPLKFRRQGRVLIVDALEK